MNLIARQIYGNKTAVTYNTYIGGVSASISTAALLATKLGISVGSISNFTVVGSDIKCKITGSYAIPNSAFINNTSLTFYDDADALVTSLGISAFEGTLAIFFRFKNVISTGNRCFYNDNKSKLIRAIYIPNCTSIGTTVNSSGDVCFGLNQRVKRLYVNPTMATINSGGVEADIAYTSSFGFTTVTYITDFTAPNPITDLSISTVYATALQLNFTAPTGSTNAIDFYDCYADGIYKNTISGSGGYITGLSPNTSLSIEVKPVDVFYNKSTSNTVTQTTNATDPYPISDIVSYYKMENNVNDSVVENNGTPTAITYASGLVGQAAVFNGTTSYVTLPSNIINNSSAYSFVCIVKSNNNTAARRPFTLNGNTGAPYISLRINDGNVLNKISFAVSATGTAVVSTEGYNTTTDLVIVGSYTVGGNVQLFVNGNLIGTVATPTTLSQVVGNSNNVIGAARDFTLKHTGQIDEVSIFNKALTALEVSEINAKLLSGQSLI